MKYCLNCRVSHEYLQKADELFVEFRDIDYIDTLIQNYSDKIIVLDVPSDATEEDWYKIRNYNIMSLQSLTLRIHDLDKSAEQAKDLDIPFFFAFPFNSFYDVRYAIDIGVSEIYVEAPLFFELDKVKLLNIPVRAVPNVANLSSWTFRREIAPYGTWIRPEDLKYYEDFIDTIEFQSPWTRVLPREEETCYRLYHDEQNWPGDLSMLIKDLGIQAINRLIPEGELKRRLTCGQRCQENGTCHLCQRVLDLASNIKELEEYQQLKENNQLRNIDDIQEEEENGEGV